MNPVEAAVVVWLVGTVIAAWAVKTGDEDADVLRSVFASAIFWPCVFVCMTFVVVAGLLTALRQRWF